MGPIRREAVGEFLHSMLHIEGFVEPKPRKVDPNIDVKAAAGYDFRDRIIKRLPERWRSALEEFSYWWFLADREPLHKKGKPPTMDAVLFDKFHIPLKAVSW